jgi:putative GTP pyrophosphokinase
MLQESILSEECVDLVWNKNPDYIRKFHKNKELYSSLCQEMAFILNKKLHQAEIEVASITTRTKSESSFCEKLNRKNYANPFIEITDFAGARVVFLYTKDRNKIENIIESEFEIIEKNDKISDADSDRFGYGALHYLVRLKPSYVGARYEEVRELICEIQVKTILQDAWAMVAHHLSYKQESDVPKHLLRKLYALSGLFETADDQFENIRSLRTQYHESVSEGIRQHNPETLNSEIELDSLIAYLDSKLPNRKSNDYSVAAELVSELKENGYNTLQGLDNILERTDEAIKAYEEAHPPFDKDNHLRSCIFSQVGAVRVGMEFLNKDFLLKNGKHEKSREIQKKLKFSHLVKN